MQLISQCSICAHYQSGGRCTAFPGEEGIPYEIRLNEVDHRQPVEGDQGIRWELTTAIPDNPFTTHPMDDGPRVLSTDPQRTV